MIGKDVLSVCGGGGDDCVSIDRQGNKQTNRKKQ